MAALVDYGSSGDEDDVQNGNQSSPKPNYPAEDGQAASSSLNDPYSETRGTENLPEPKRPSTETVTAFPAPLVGPVLGPTIPADMPMAEGLENGDQDIEQDSTPQSPYSANRALLRDLTLPTIASYDIPPSPPGSPLASTNAKFKHFLELKKQGVHFNEKLARSSALKNPSLMQKLMDFADIDEIGQYMTTLPKDIWDPESFPAYAYKEDLAKSQQKILKRKEDEKSRGQREAVDFVPASVSGESSRSGTPSLSKGGQKSAAERVMAGLDRGRSNSPQVQGVKRKSRFES
ncbi:hypothetical protein BP6252_05376 [Coleophoma cylindrospora]|uniref:HCNGP-domain-containing protein n=1 Tax=Coleophoma cylindrospora TaxID=1849047 RepID=A0A3D8RTE9_9HELO|nr:hypothetical protein BP6252_05376 [Coleophoma cylindrospora]